MNNITDSKVYIKLYINKRYKSMIKNGELNYDMLKIGFYNESPYYRDEDYEDDNYFLFECDDYSSVSLGMILDGLYKYTVKDYMACVYYDKDNIKYKYVVKDEMVSLNGREISFYDDRYNQLKSYIVEAVDRFSDYFMYIDDNRLFGEIVPNKGLDCGDFEDLADRLKNSEEMLLFEIPFMEEVAYLINIVEPKLFDIYDKNKKDTIKSWPKVEEVFVPAWEDSFEKKKKDIKRKKSFFGSLFDREADLWGLSREDRRIAKEERMSPADYVEAEERDDDELVDDKW